MNHMTKLNIQWRRSTKGAESRRNLNERGVIEPTARIVIIPSSRRKIPEAERTLRRVYRAWTCVGPGKLCGCMMAVLTVRSNPSGWTGILETLQFDCNHISKFTNISRTKVISAQLRYS